MVCAIFGMVMLIILYAGCYRMCCSGNQPYHDSCIKATIHIVLTLLTYVLYLFDTLSDVFLFLHYIAIGQTSKFALVMAFTFAPVLFLAFIFFAKHHKKLECDYHKLSCREQLCFQMFGLVLVLVCSPFAALLPTYTYAQVLARGKTNFKFEYLTSYITLVEATLESAPQLTVQIYLLIIDSHTDTTYTGIIRYLSIIASSLGLAWSLNAFKHQNRKKMQNKEDGFCVKLIHWISRFAEIVPRIILIALCTAEYSVYVLFFVMYRFLCGCMYSLCERWAIDEKFRFLEEPDLILGIVGNIFCYSVSKIYQCQKKEQCGGKFFVGYYIIYYIENGIMLFFWYSDDPALLQLKIGGACSNHAWWAPGVIVFVSILCVVQLLFLYLYYRLRGKQPQVNSQNMSAEKCHQSDPLNSDSFTNHGQFDNHGFQDGLKTYNFHDGQVASPYDIDSQYANDSQMQPYCGYERNNQPVYRYPREELHVTQSYESDVNNRWNSEPYQNISQQSQQIQQYNMNPLQQWNDYHSQRGCYESNMSNRQTHFASSFHNQTFVGNVSSSYQSSMQSMTQGAVFTGTQYNSQGEYRFSGY
ncbi:uncharacterized protein LOC134684091 [Mytilus trossulus]|uniref:uncharacterized protein LOC134684091 n=1 Tax=Mytilus trossulus TaxID=6551 RepID=UPI003004CD55